MPQAKTPGKSQGGDSMKQKSLMSFFAKAPAATDSKPATSTNKEHAPKTPAKMPTKARVTSNARVQELSSDPAASSELHTPSKGPGASQSSGVVSAKYSRGSDATSARDTPPTSDAIDVDMLYDNEEETEIQEIKSKSTVASKLKRKIIVDDSDEESLMKSPTVLQGKSKKPRLIALLSDDEAEVALDDSLATKLSKRLSKYKQSPKKGKTKRRSSKVIDDDDFIIPDDEEEGDEDEPSTSRALSGGSKRDSFHTSSRLSQYAYSASEAEETEEPLAPKKSALKPAPTKRPDIVRDSSSKGSNIFLTAAEQRTQQQKEEKKSSEDPFEFLLDPKDKDGVKPGEPGYDPRTLYIPAKAWRTFTPFEKQFWEIKQNHFDTVLFFQKGKFLELYEEDARIGHQEFDLKLTQRVKMSMVGVPEQSFNFWAAKFLAKGYKVGRVDQAETALGAEMRVAADKGKAKGKQSAEEKGKDKIVRRELNKVYTNGTLVDEALLTDEQAGHCVSIREEEEGSGKKDEEGRFGLCVLDSATSEFNMSAFEDDVCRTRLETMMRQLRPKEIVFTKGNLSVSTTRLVKAVLPSGCLWTSLRESEGLSFDGTVKELKTLYPSEDGDEEMDDNAHGLTSAVPEAIRTMMHSKPAVEALGSMIWYLRTLNIDKDILSMKNFNIYDPMKRGQGLVLDGQTLAHIEVLVNNEGTEDGTLLKLLSKCITPSGKRLFRIWLCMPLREISDINSRLDAVQDLLDHPTFESEFTDVAKGLPDLERIVSRIHAKNCRVRDFLKVLDAFKRLSKGLAALADTAEGFHTKTIFGLLRSAPDLMPHLKHVKAMFQSPVDNSDELVPQEGKDEAYDEITEEIKGLEEQLDGELKSLEKQTKLKLSYWHSAQGTKDIYLVQTKPNDKVPKDWTKSNTTKAAARWIVPSLASTIRSLKEAREHRNTATKNFKSRLYAEFDADRSVYLRAVRVLSELDCLFSLAKASSALDEPKCRPEFVEGDTAFVDFEELRHPALSTAKTDFIPNDVKMGGDVGRIVLLTGPNMGGKSTAMRMTAVGVIMAQLGMFVPARKARICPVDAILTRMGAYDNMFSNASTFKVELDECCKILREATPRSLVILDELGRGTSTYDGMAIAGAVLHQLATHTLALSFFATHYGSLTDDFSYHPNIRNMHMATLVDDEQRELVFLYKLTQGAASSSFGTHVASLAGVPREVVDRADTVSKDFARTFKEKIEGKRKDKASSRLPLVSQADFAYLYGLATGRCKLPDDRVRQREILKGLKGALRGSLAQSVAA